MAIPVFDKNDKLVHLEIDEVYSIYKQEKSRRITVESTRGEFYLPSTINQIKRIMEPSGFFLIDKNRIVNLKHVKAYERCKVTVDGSKYTVSRRNRKELEEKLSN